MQPDFLQYLVLILIALLFAKEYLPAILEKLGIKAKKEKSFANDVADLLGTNHFHELIPTLKEIQNTLGRIEKGIEKHDEKEMPLLNEIIKSANYIEGRLNGKKHE